jgi:hypothetical protein
MAASQARMDMMSVGLGAAAFAVYVNWREKSPMRAVFWSHTLAALAVLTHPVGIVYWAGLLCFMLLLDRRAFSIKLLAVAAVPYLLAGLAWGAYILQDPSAFRDQFETILELQRRVFFDPKLSHWRFLQSFEQEVRDRYASPFGLLPGAGAANRLKALVLAAYLTGVFGILLVKRLRRQKNVVIFPALWIAAFILMAEFAPSKYYYYLAHSTVIMAACLGIFLWNAVRPPTRVWVIAGVMIVVGGLQVAGAVRTIHRDEYHRSFMPAADAIARNSASGSLVMGSNELWVRLSPNRKVLNDPVLGYRSGLQPAVIVTDPVYRMLHDGNRQLLPAAHDHVENLLQQSRLVYDDGYYQVYTCRGATK